MDYKKITAIVRREVLEDVAAALQKGGAEGISPSLGSDLTKLRNRKDYP